MDPQPSLICGPLWLSDNGTSWIEVWATIPTSDPRVLDLRGGSEDGRLPHAIPLSGCRVSTPDPEEGPAAGCLWKLQQGQQLWYLRAASKELQQSWLGALRAAAQDGPGALQPQAPAGTAAP